MQMPQVNRLKAMNNSVYPVCTNVDQYTMGSSSRPTIMASHSTGLMRRSPATNQGISQSTSSTGSHMQGRVVICASGPVGDATAWINENTSRGTPAQPETFCGLEGSDTCRTISAQADRSARHRRIFARYLDSFRLT